jgi:tetratricopeptide (TPR) repeat protein
MRIAVSVFVLLAIFGAPSTASAQSGDPLTDCERGVMEACWAIRFGRCAHQEPEIAIPACTRQLVNPNRMLDNSAFAALRRADHAQRYSLRATAYAKQGNFEQALEDYDRAIRAHGGLYWIHALRASALYATGSEQGALDSLNDAIDLAPDNPLLFNARPGCSPAPRTKTCATPCKRSPMRKEQANLFRTAQIS